MINDEKLMQQPIGWIYEDDEGRMMFSQMPLLSAQGENHD